jgi:hypothetical protein
VPQIEKVFAFFAGQTKNIVANTLVSAACVSHQRVGQGRDKVGQKSEPPATEGGSDKGLELGVGGRHDSFGGVLHTFGGEDIDT